MLQLTGSNLEAGKVTLAGRAADQTAATQARLTLGWADTSRFVGDRIERVDGRTLELACRPHRLPAVVRVTHDFTSFRTDLLVEG
jgi:hypothetical protein